MRRIHHRYDPLTGNRDYDYERRMAGQIALILFALSAIGCVLALAWLFVKVIIAMLVFAQ